MQPKTGSQLCFATNDSVPIYTQQPSSALHCFVRIPADTICTDSIQPLPAKAATQTLKQVSKPTVSHALLRKLRF